MARRPITLSAISILVFGFALASWPSAAADRPSNETPTAVARQHCAARRVSFEGIANFSEVMATLYRGALTVDLKSN
jgi:hypothetical protein